MNPDFYLPWHYFWLPPAAAALDLLLGDPRRWPHPVNLIGRLLTVFERPLLALRRCRKTAGALLLLSALLLSAAAALLFINAPGLIFLNTKFTGLTEFLEICLALYLAYSGLALGCLLREGRKAALAIVEAERAAAGCGGAAEACLQAARLAVSGLVSRDVSRLTPADLYRTLAESLSENFNDAFVAPFFWLLLGGPTGLWVYKCASTADSRWGYRHEPWNRPGWASARLDDALAFAPARLSAFLLYLSSGRQGWKNWPGWPEFRRQALLMESPNAGWSMAAAAWLHAAGMGGPAVYAGKVKDKPRLGPEAGAGREWNALKIALLERHLLLAGLLGTALLTAPLVLLHLFAG